MIGRTISHYKIFEQIGDGATAVVYKAEDLQLGRPVALKLFDFDTSTDYGALAHLQHEARTISSLNHPNICTIHEVTEYRGRPLIAMELLEGDVLSRLIGGRPMEPYRVIELAIQLADALDAVHSEGIIHRDVKSANIFVTKRDQIKLLDFGLAVFVPKRKPHSPVETNWLGTTAGTIPFMSPEQVRGEMVDLRTDLFSMGVVLYEMLTGRRPFVGRNVAEIQENIGNRSPIVLPDLGPSAPADLSRIVAKALEKNRKLRFQTAADLRCDLQRLKRDLDSTESIAVTASQDRPFGVAGVHQNSTRTGTPLHKRAALALTAAGMASLGLHAWLADVPSAPPAPLGLVSSVEPLPIPTETTAVIPKPAGRTPAIAPAKAPAEKPASPAVVGVEEPSTGTALGPAPAELSSWGERELQIAQTKADLKLYDQALDTLRGLLERDGDRRNIINAHFLMASIRQRQGKSEDAMAAYLDIANRYPDDQRTPEALYQLAQEMLRSRRSDKETEARAILTRADTGHPDNVWTLRALLARAVLEERRNLRTGDEVLQAQVPAALVTYRRIVERYGQDPQSVTAHLKLAHAYGSVDRYDLAAEAFVQLATAFPSTAADAWFSAGEIYEERLKDYAKARAAYLRVPSSSGRYKNASKRAAALEGRP